RNISFVIRSGDESKALNTLHDAFFLGGVKTIHLFLVGVGLIGSTLLGLIRKQLQSLYENYLIDINLMGLANSRKMVIRKKGIALDEWEEVLNGEGEESDLDAFIRQMEALN